MVLQTLPPHDLFSRGSVWKKEAVEPSARPSNANQHEIIMLYTQL